jgi:hypothetical protein
MSRFRLGIIFATLAIAAIGASVFLIGFKHDDVAMQKSTKVIEAQGAQFKQQGVGSESGKPPADLKPIANSNSSFEQLTAQVKGMNEATLEQRKRVIQSEIKELDLVERFNRHVLSPDETRKLRTIALESSIITLRQIEGTE